MTRKSADEPRSLALLIGYLVALLCIGLISQSVVVMMLGAMMGTAGTISWTIDNRRHMRRIYPPCDPWEVLCPDCDSGVRGGKPCETCSMTGLVMVVLARGDHGGQR